MKSVTVVSCAMVEAVLCWYPEDVSQFCNLKDGTASLNGA